MKKSSGLISLLLLPSCSIRNASQPIYYQQPHTVKAIEEPIQTDCLERLNQLVDDIEVLGLMYEEERYKGAGDEKTSKKYTQEIGNRIPKILTPDDKLYFESLELSDSLQDLSPLQLESNRDNIRDVKKVLKKFKRDNYKPPISREEWKRANDIYGRCIRDTDGLSS